ncbi:MAG: hypothetical protein MR384_06855 [Lachnospiraceae bacterium]|nr:hypothetical protein [Lachnospiraceae bacterium]
MNGNLKEHGIELRERMCQFISEYISNMGYPPTIREIGKAVGLKSSSSVHSHLTQLEIEGRIETKPYCPRAIRVIRDKKVED